MNKVETIKLAILTSSNKARHDRSYGNCVAGVTSSGKWIRLVSDAAGDSIATNEAKQIPLCKVIEAEIEYVPLTYQTENAVLAKLCGTTQDDVKQYVQAIQPVKEAGIFGTKSNQLTKYEMQYSRGTLRLIHVEDLTTYRHENEKCKAKFNYQGQEYTEISMTAPNWYAAEGTERKIGNAAVIVSLPNDQPFRKFIAAIYNKSEMG